MLYAMHLESITNYGNRLIEVLDFVGEFDRVVETVPNSTKTTRPEEQGDA
jgi:hypothetical protein